MMVYVSYFHVRGYVIAFRFMMWVARTGILKTATLVKVSSKRAELCAGADDHVS